MGTRIKAHLLTARDRDAALAYLARDARHNLLLMEMVASVGAPLGPSEIPPQVVAAWRGREIVGVASLRPSVVLDAAMDDGPLDACLSALLSVETGLIKCPQHVVDPLWARLEARGRTALIDRVETAYAISAEAWSGRDVALPTGMKLRRAGPRDLEDLVFAARASLREESRPDPFDGDPVGFRRWVRGRISRARLVELDGRIAFVGYADVRRRDGWLIQGVYTWRELRRRGCARVGMAGLVDEAFAAGADHVQLAVVEGNEPAIALYETLGFEPFATLRTILFI